MTGGAMNRATQTALLLVAAAALIAAPFYLGAYSLTLLGRVLALSIAALGICVVWGRTGILSLGQGLFFGLGGYALAMHLKLAATAKGELPDFMVYNGVESLPWFWKPFASAPFALAMVLILPALAAGLVAWLMFRRRITGVYVSIITQALVLAFVTWLNGSQGLTSGTNGITDFQTFLGIDLRSSGTGLTHGLYWVTLLILGVCMAGTSWLLRTHFGSLLTAIQGNENRVRFLGYNPAAYKIAAFAFGGLLSGLSGALYTLHLGTISPAMIGVTFSIELVVWVALGGRASIVGAVGGMVAGQLAKDRISSAVPDAWLYIMGALFVLVVLVLPQGVAGLLNRRGSAGGSEVEAGAGHAADLPRTSKTGEQA
ncbi:urea ABC transporter permease subunit UrtC (plasmid) [Deinococcus sp. KNUC1210]|uniref:urea ABC transporter permease subunit UrtC n=1 Tax=Deinococcus sp. KNUC1210 TaxID=2917691 RepID=UPI001EEF8823|nr:urea ABC transporter permease subunit UrtC [Deinococcus sp. KNUC1210]ULH17169.1 urea ABC transporter permease subunit UrtC [Deinococcus sp. KNUC1210]